MKGIDVAALERELTAQWAEMSRQQREGVHASITRACVLNLVVYVGRRNERAAMEAALEEATAEHPCRVLVLLADRDAAEERLDAHVSTRCRELTRGARQLCGEQVTIEAGSAVVERVASAVEPLLIPDVPVFLWWKDIPHTDDKLFNRLAATADRVVIDSAFCDHPHLDLLRLSKMLSATKESMRLSDVNWGRMTSWRTLVASFWDVPDYRSHLERIDQVRIEYVAPEMAAGEIAPQAWLMAGWLASRLGWQMVGASPPSEDRWSASFELKTSDNRRVRIEMRAVEPVAGCEGYVAALTLGTEETQAQFHVEYRPERTKLETSASIGGTHAVGRVLAYEARSEGKRLSSELALLTRDEIYEQAVHAAATMVEALEKARSLTPDK